VTPFEELETGGVVLLSTDTLPGLHSLASHPDAAEALRRCKGSPVGRPFLLLFADLESVLRHGAPRSERQLAELRLAWPGPLTALLVPKAETPPSWIHEGRSMAARVPAHPELRAVLARLGAPLFSTSVNRAGETPATSMAEARRRFPSLAVLLDAGSEGPAEASTLVDLTCDPARVLREGAAPWPPQGAA
jgi:L-threonylcarbamoyladenylate synthase